MADGLVNAYLQFDSDEIVLVERKGDRIYCKRIPAEHACFLKKSETTQEVYGKLISSNVVRGVSDDGNYWRIKWKTRKLCILACETLSTYDGDVAPIRRYLTDTGREIVRPRGVYLDIEADSRCAFSQKENARILCWTLVCSATGREIRGMLNEDTDQDESRLLRELFQALNDFDQVLSWNGDRYDFEVIEARVKLHRLPFPVRRWLWLDHLTLFQKMNMAAAESGDEKQSMALEAIAQAVLGRGKVEDFDSSKTWQVWASGDRQKLADYCALDTQLMRDIELETGYVELFHTLCEVSGVFPDSKSLNPTTRVEGMLFAIAKNQGFRFKTRLERGGTEEDKYKGAFVLRPTKSGILKSVHVCDFSGLYPSIIISWNASPETKVSKTDGPRPEYVCEAPGTGAWFDTRTKGILAIACEHLLKLRAEWQTKEAQLPPNTPEWHAARRMTTAYKIAVNAIYGVVGSHWSRFFDREVAEAITQVGAWLIKHVIAAGEQKGLETVSGDTDSNFVIGSGADEFRRFVAYCNQDLIPDLVKNCGCAESRIKLAYEKEFERLIIPLGKGDQITSKRYCGALAHYKGQVATDDSEPEIKGFEFKRGDSSRLTRSMQKQVIDLLCKAKSEDPDAFEDLCEGYRKRVMESPLDLADVKVSKALGKPLKGYLRKTKKDGTPSNLPPHVEVGLLLAERGREVGEGVKVDYVVVDGAAKPKKVIPAEDWTGEFDRYELWDSIVWPPTMRILKAAFPAHDWFGLDSIRPTKKRLKEENLRKQTNLLDYIDEAMANR